MATIVYEREIGLGTILNIHGKELAPVVQKLDSVIQLLNNWGQGSILLRHWIK